MKRATMTLLAAIACNGAYADTIGLFAGVSGWNADFTGDVQSGSESVDLENDLGLGDDTFIQGYVAFEHFVPGLPNLRLQYTELSQNGQGTLTKTFDGVTFTGDVDTDVDLTHTDLIAYWRLLDNVVSLDLGLQARIFDGEITIKQKGASTNESTTAIDEVVPMLYGAVGVDLPLTGLSVGASLAGLKYSDNRMLDVAARINYEIEVVGVELGWREMQLELDDVSDVDADVDIGGPYLGVSVHF
ncbi:TIGR04219 family outer membrane beta-barrel protein [Hahella sp. KA22]|uniref:TIGR04219 family outer membrane beta-barrel protein n=1 Tax=Hahella sp. KA22 TaxID=1628392 RepID=UPI000FDE748B|nr:TIGR04219 family outer membrane beta-barrel protein [Hahella sp. KA22]AZZ91211.1 TIGR04219 family outer membrane beta-barrel protein [Hahella sp. KA22]QAY54579.1 TIGR04219 family outer membrane beta-barrel protein [Hahella sp. KA22]